MQKNGKIVNIVPTNGYSGTHGWIHTYQMTIACQDGQFTGEIGSKSSPYPLTVGQEISVMIENTEHGTRFTKFNPQYAGQAGSQSPQSTPQGAQNRPQSSNRDYDKENRGKCRFGFYQADMSSGKFCATSLINDAVELQAIEKLVEQSMNGLGGTPNPDWVGDNPPPLTDEIPY